MPFEPRWHPPRRAEEDCELERTAVDLGIPLESLREAFRSGSLVDLEGWVWCSMDNTDSNETFCLAEAEARAKLYGRNLERIVLGMSARSSLPAPIVLLRGQGRPYLVAGNTRLMACRALGVRPKVWLMRLEES